MNSRQHRAAGPARRPKMQHCLAVPAGRMRTDLHKGCLYVAMRRRLDLVNSVIQTQACRLCCFAQPTHRLARAPPGCRGVTAARQRCSAAAGTRSTTSAASGRRTPTLCRRTCPVTASEKLSDGRPFNWQAVPGRNMVFPPASTHGALLWRGLPAAKSPAQCRTTP